MTLIPFIIAKANYKKNERVEFGNFVFVAAENIAFGDYLQVSNKDGNLYRAWRCFHCNEVFATPEAKEHFGLNPRVEPACTVPVKRLRELEAENEDLRARNRSLEYAEEALAHDRHTLGTLFGKEVTSVEVAGDRYNNVHFELTQERAKTRQLLAAIEFADKQITELQSINARLFRTIENICQVADYLVTPFKDYHKGKLVSAIEDARRLLKAR